jgi:hypothetical protein
MSLSTVPSSWTACTTPTPARRATQPVK